MAELGLLGSIISSVAPPAPSTLEVEVFPRFPRFELLLHPADDFDMDLCIPPPLFEPKKIPEDRSVQDLKIVKRTSKDLFLDPETIIRFFKMASLKF
jgi:hypothetical protein